MRRSPITALKQKIPTWITWTQNNGKNAAGVPGPLKNSGLDGAGTIRLFSESIQRIRRKLKPQ